MSYVMALDGGGTKTSAALATVEGEVLAIAQAGASNPSFTPLESARTEVRRALVEAMARAGVDAGQVKALAVCLAGPMEMEDIAHDAAPAAVFRVYPEPVVCLASAYERERGAVVLSGTGSFEWAIGPGGAVRADGRGALLGDEGSAYRLALAGFTAAGRALDGRGPDTSLRDILGPMAYDFYRRGLSMERHQVAAAAPVVTEAALRGDRVARMLCRMAARQLARGLYVCMRGAGLLDQKVTVALAGSVLRETTAVREPLTGMIASFAPEAAVTVPVLDPLRGGLLLALTQIGVGWDADVRRRLEASMEARVPG